MSHVVHGLSQSARTCRPRLVSQPKSAPTPAAERRRHDLRDVSGVGTRRTATGCASSAGWWHAIIDQFPPDQGGTILFAGAGSSSHVADVAGHVAKHLTTVCHSDVMLVDADAADRVLTQRFAAGTEKGLVEALQDGTPAGRFAVSTAVPAWRFWRLAKAWHRGVGPRPSGARHRRRMEDQLPLHRHRGRHSSRH